MNLDTALWIGGISAEILVLGLLLYRRVWRVFPFFFAYNIWSLTGNAAGVALLHWSSSSSRVYVFFYLTYLLLDSVLLFAVLVEVGWSVIKPLRKSLPRSALVGIVLVILTVGAITWVFVSLPGAADLTRELAILMRLRQTVAYLAILAFLVLAAGSQFLAIGWRNRELQIATGLGLYSIVDIVITILHTYPQLRPHYNDLEELLVASYFCSLLYWFYSFAQNEQERREMSPQAQNLLLAMAGTARSTRIALANTRADSNEDLK